jgi:hypothetical protein
MELIIDMSKINIEFKDRIVEFPNRYVETDNGDGTKTLTPFPGEIVKEGTLVNAGHLNEIITQFNALYDYIHNPDRGYKSFSGQFASSSPIDLYIPIKEGAKQGIAVVQSNTSQNYGIMVQFNTNPQWGFVTGSAIVGLYDDVSGSAWSVRDKGFVTDGIGYGAGVLGNTRFCMDAFYIEGNNIKITIRKGTSSLDAYDFTVDYEVR